MRGGYCRNCGTRGSPDAVKVGPPLVGPPRRRTRQGFNTNPTDNAEVPGTRRLDRRIGSHPRSSLRTGEEDKLASPCWKLVEDLGAKKMEAPRGDTVGKGVSPCPPALQ